MKKIIIIVELFFLSFCLCYAQITKPKNSIYMEILGNGIIYSINYDRLIDESKGFRVGFMYLFEREYNSMGPTGNFDSILMIPMTVNYLLGKTMHKAEFGIGITYASYKTDDPPFDLSKYQFMGTGTIGYRFMPKKDGITLRAGFTPIYLNNTIRLWGGLSIGVSF